MRIEIVPAPPSDERRALEQALEAVLARPVELSLWWQEGVCAATYGRLDEPAGAPGWAQRRPF